VARLLERGTFETAGKLYAAAPPGDVLVIIASQHTTRGWQIPESELRSCLAVARTRLEEIAEALGSGGSRGAGTELSDLSPDLCGDDIMPGVFAVTLNRNKLHHSEIGLLVRSETSADITAQFAAVGATPALIGLLSKNGKMAVTFNFLVANAWPGAPAGSA
jgi:hypothetical protein